MYISDSMDEFRHFSTWNIVVSSWSKFLLKGTGLCYLLDSFFLIWAIGLLMSLWSERCFMAASWQSQHLWVKKKTKQKKKIIEMVPDQTQLRSKTLLIRPKMRSKRLWSDSIAPEVASDQTQVRSNPPMIRIFRPNRPLIRPSPDHRPDRSALELPSRPCNFGLGTHGCALNWVWS